MSLWQAYDLTGPNGSVAAQGIGASSISCDIGRFYIRGLLNVYSITAP